MKHAELLSLSSTTRDGWIAVAHYRMPPVETVVIGWHGEHQCPVAVFYDTSAPGKPQWSAKADGEAFPVDAITHWRCCARPGEAEPSRPVLVLEAPYCALHILKKSLVDHVSMRAAQLGEVLRMMAAEHPDNFMLKLCARLSAELRVAFDNLPEGELLVLATQIAEICLSEQEDDDGPGDLLWLCQQMADELRDILDAMMQNENKGGVQ